MIEDALFDLHPVFDGVTVDLNLIPSSEKHDSAME